MSTTFNPPLERVIISSQKEYSINLESLQHKRSSPFLRLRGMSIVCNTLNFPQGVKLRLRLRDRKSYHIIEEEVSPEINKSALCVFDFGVEERYFTKDLVVSLQMVRDGKVIEGDITLVRGTNFPEFTWKDKSGNNFTPALTLYGYTVDPDTGNQGFFYATTAYPETEYPATPYPTMSYLSTEYDNLCAFGNMYATQGELGAYPASSGLNSLSNSSSA